MTPRARQRLEVRQSSSNSPTLPRIPDDRPNPFAVATSTPVRSSSPRTCIPSEPSPHPEPLRGPRGPPYGAGQKRPPPARTPRLTNAAAAVPTTGNGRWTVSVVQDGRLKPNSWHRQYVDASVVGCDECDAHELIRLCPDVCGHRGPTAADAS